VSRRARAVAFLLMAGICAAIAVAIADGYSDRVSSQLGTLRAVLVASEDLPGGRTIEPRDAARRLEVRRVPERFAPPDALARPEEAIGRSPAARLPAGAYVLASQLRAPERRRERGPKLGRGRSPVDIEVSGAGALLLGEGKSTKVDAVITTEPRASGRGRTYVAARGIRLLSLIEGGAGRAVEELPGPPRWTATLALTRGEALRLIQAESYARQIRLLARLPSRTDQTDGTGDPG
jgi:Flp pilus assembly protein CpaB